jgi:4-hydroxy-tetrahydrodipicolinate synthase
MFSGCITALVTPMDADGRIDYSALARLIDFQIDAGTQALVIAGTTGESATLTRREHIELVERSCELAGGRVPIIAGTGSNSTAQTMGLSKTIDAFPIAGFLLVTPYYNKPTQEGMIRHFTAVADAVDRPVILYNVPGRTGVDLKPDTVIRLAAHARIVGVKEATGDLARVATLRAGCGESFALLSGDDATACEFMLQGGDGVISVTSNVAPLAMRRLCDAALGGDRPAAERIDKTLQGLHSTLFMESNPIPVKWAVARLGLMQDGIRLPLTPLSPGCQAPLRAAMRQAGVSEAAA